MIRNVGNTDRIVRVIIGILLLAYVIFATAGGWWWIVGLIGLVLIVTGAIGTCPLYAALGMSTAEKQAKS